MLPLLVGLFIVVPLVELYVIIQVGQAIGVWWTLGLLVADSVLGSMLMRSQGRIAWRRFQVAVSEGRVPAREVLDGVLVIFGGAFLLTPGFVTDIAGAVLLVPPTRAVVRRILARRFTFSLLSDVPNPRVRRPRGPGATGGRGDDYVEGTATEVDPRRLP